MSSALNAPADDVKKWPLVVGVVLLLTGSVLYLRLGNHRLSLALAALAFVTPLIGLFLRSYLSSSKEPRVRRVLVDDAPPPISSVQLESAKYYTPPARPGLRSPGEVSLPS